jgi:hypothetical protein
MYVESDRLPGIGQEHWDAFACQLRAKLGRDPDEEFENLVTWFLTCLKGMRHSSVQVSAGSNILAQTFLESATEYPEVLPLMQEMYRASVLAW